MRAATLTARVLLTGSLAGLAACMGGGAANKPGQPKPPTYLGVDTAALRGDLVQVKTRVGGAETVDALTDYTRCAAAGYAVRHKAGFVRNVRTLTDKEGGIWRADAVYSITSALPNGLQTIDAQVTVEDCLARGIPTE